MSPQRGFTKRLLNHYLGDATIQQLIFIGMPNSMEIKEYVTRTGKTPFREWLNRMCDLRAKAKILQRLDRLTLGHFGDHKYLQEGVYELRIFEGKGYRIYYGKEADTIILLLCGGDKHSQTRDLQTARLYWQNYQRGN